MFSLLSSGFSILDPSQVTSLLTGSSSTSPSTPAATSTTTIKQGVPSYLSPTGPAIYIPGFSNTTITVPSSTTVLIPNATPAILTALPQVASSPIIPTIASVPLNSGTTTIPTVLSTPSQVAIASLTSS